VAASLLEKDRSFDLLFTDVVMPGATSAVELAEKAQRLWPGIAVLLTSGYARDLISRQDRQDYPMIAKPYRAKSWRPRYGWSWRRAGRRRLRRQARLRPLPAGLSTIGRAACWWSRTRWCCACRRSTCSRRLGCSAAAVGTGEQALELLSKDQSFSLLLTDLGLPGMSGEVLAAEVQRRFPALAVVIASATAVSEARATDPVHLQALFVGRPRASPRPRRARSRRLLIITATLSIVRAFIRHRKVKRGAI